LLRRAGRSSEPQKGLEAVATLRQELEALERHHVAAACSEGWSWSKVAAALGISKQAAHKRHAKAVRAMQQAHQEAAAAEARVVVTGAARNAVQFARAEASATGSKIVGTEHLLIGVLSSAGPAELRVLHGEGVDIDAARACLQPTLPEEERAIAVTDTGTAAAAAATGMSPLARACLEQSLRETVRRDDGQLDTKHLLLAIVSRPDGGAARTLERLGTSPESVRRLLEARAAT
jgi:ATP-dependent Clp protease ATP-binding subunit ClpA